MVFVVGRWRCPYHIAHAHAHAHVLLHPHTQAHTDRTSCCLRVSPLTRHHLATTIHHTRLTCRFKW